MYAYNMFGLENFPILDLFGEQQGTQQLLMGGAGVVQEQPMMGGALIKTKDVQEAAPVTQRNAERPSENSNESSSGLTQTRICEGVQIKVFADSSESPESPELIELCYTAENMLYGVYKDTIENSDRRTNKTKTYRHNLNRLKISSITNKDSNIKVFGRNSRTEFEVTASTSSDILASIIELMYTVTIPSTPAISPPPKCNNIPGIEMTFVQDGQLGNVCYTASDICNGAINSILPKNENNVWIQDTSEILIKSINNTDPQHIKLSGSNTQSTIDTLSSTTSAAVLGSINTLEYTILNTQCSAPKNNQGDGDQNDKTNKGDEAEQPNTMFMGMGMGLLIIICVVMLLVVVGGVVLIFVMRSKSVPLPKAKVKIGNIGGIFSVGD